MPVIVEVIIDRPASEVWAVILDASSHPHWLGSGGTTQYDTPGEVVEGTTFTRVNRRDGRRIEGEIVSLRAPQLLMVRAQTTGSDIFVTTDYHLIAVGARCVVRVVTEYYKTGEGHHIYFPEMLEKQWQGDLARLKQHCER